MTNFEKIKGYSIEEMAEFIYYANEFSEDLCPYPCDYCKRDNNECTRSTYNSGAVQKEYCVQGVIEWLNSEIESEAEGNA